MSILAALRHVTHYRYDRPVVLGPQTVRLRPAPDPRMRVSAYRLSVLPETRFLHWQQDPFGNVVARLVFPEKASELSVAVDLVADMAASNPFDFLVETDAESWPFRYEASLARDLRAFTEPDAAGPRLAGFLRDLDRPATGTVDLLVGLNRAVAERVAYLVRLEAGVQTPEETLERGSGSCRDSSWLLVQVLRHLGFAARFVSGYLVQLAPDVAPSGGPAGAGGDVADLHAWAEAYLPGAGWIGFDPTSGFVTGEGHLALAAAPHHRSAAPISGSLEAADAAIGFEMSVRRIAGREGADLP